MPNPRINGDQRGSPEPRLGPPGLAFDVGGIESTFNSRQQSLIYHPTSTENKEPTAKSIGFTPTSAQYDRVAHGWWTGLRTLTSSRPRVVASVEPVVEQTQCDLSGPCVMLKDKTGCNGCKLDDTQRISSYKLCPIDKT
uniref:Uncharacterized protein n=1 Tax=Oryza sativa subsp. japonica TaxID=39947 RepID=Q8S6B1_ORYSJ|nr:hypothetical protein [Oryza sativa Japonica Group]